MKLLTYEDSIYRIKDKEMDILNSMLVNIKENDLDETKDEIANYIEIKIELGSYKHIGFIDFSYRR